eukprot:scaffold106143_cov21-Tisochrysis_lutea.AAC.1
MLVPPFPHPLCFHPLFFITATLSMLHSPCTPLPSPCSPAAIGSFLTALSLAAAVAAALAACVATQAGLTCAGLP